MKKYLRSLEFVFVLLLLAATESSAWSRPVKADDNTLNVDLPLVQNPAYMFLPELAVNYFSGILPPKYATGVQTGPEGGTVTALAIDSAGVIYAGSWGSGVYKSVDHGSTWTFSKPGPGEWFYLFPGHRPK